MILLPRAETAFTYGSFHVGQRFSVLPVLETRTNVRTVGADGPFHASRIESRIWSIATTTHE